MHQSNIKCFRVFDGLHGEIFSFSVLRNRIVNTWRGVQCWSAEVDTEWFNMQPQAMSKYHCHDVTEIYYIVMSQMLIIWITDILYCYLPTSHKYTGQPSNIEKKDINISYLHICISREQRFYVSIKCCWKCKAFVKKIFHRRLYPATWRCLDIETIYLLLVFVYENPPVPLTKGK